MLDLNNNKGQRLLSFSHRNLEVKFFIHQEREFSMISHSITTTLFIIFIRKHCPSTHVTRTIYSQFSSFEPESLVHSSSSLLVLLTIRVSSVCVFYPLPMSFPPFYFLSQLYFVGQVMKFHMVLFPSLSLTLEGLLPNYHLDWLLSFFVPEYCSRDVHLYLARY
jgi:hypothetical protein